MMAWDIEKAIIAQGYRYWAKKQHPDHGGTAEGMIALNAARDRLLEMLENVREGLRAANYPQSQIDPLTEAFRRHMNQPTHPTTIKEAFDQLFGEGNFERITETFGSVQDFVRVFNGHKPKSARRAVRRKR